MACLPGITAHSHPKPHGPLLAPWDRLHFVRTCIAMSMHVCRFYTGTHSHLKIYHLPTGNNKTCNNLPWLWYFYVCHKCLLFEHRMLPLMSLLPLTRCVLRSKRSLTQSWTSVNTYLKGAQRNAAGTQGQSARAWRARLQQLQTPPCPELVSGCGLPPPPFCPWVSEGDSGRWGTWHGRDWSQGLPRELL